MQMIIDGRLYDTDLAREVADNSEWLGPCRSPTGGRCKVTETLYREIALKPGVSLSEARSRTSWGGYVWDDDKIDHRKGAFFLVVRIGWSGNDSSAVRPVTEDQAKSWFERYHGDEVDKYRCTFGAPSTCLPGYQEETERERELRDRESELRDRESELARLRDELAAAKVDAAKARAAEQAAEDRLLQISGGPDLELKADDVFSDPAGPEV